MIGVLISAQLFENKIDHATYFGASPEYIQGYLAPSSLLLLLLLSLSTPPPTIIYPDHPTLFAKICNRIHMLPLNPSTPYTRPQKFVAEEWNTYFSPSSPYPASTIQGGWKGILYANLALIDAKSSWDFFAQAGFDGSWIDGGASRTWYLAFAAGKLDFLAS